MLFKYDESNDKNKNLKDPRDVVNIIEGEELPPELLQDIEEPSVLKIALEHK